MADNMEPPPLFENININKIEDSENDLFESAIQDIPPSLDEDNSDLFNGDFSTLKITDTKSDMETVPINSSNSIRTPTLEELEVEGGDQYLEISVIESQKVGDGMGAYVAYRILTKTNMTIFKKNTFSVMRRFSDFLGLHDKLTEKYLKNGRIIPPAPEKSVIGMTKIKITNQQEQGTSGGDFIEKRRASLERYLRRTAAHPVLSIDPDFRLFLEADIELPKSTNTSALSSAGVMRLFNKVGETVNKITYKMDETDPWFEEKIQHIEMLDVQLRKLHSSIETLVINRRDLANLTAGVSKSAAMLSSCEDHNSLSRVLSQLADTEEKVENLHVEQANTDFFILGELLKDYIGLLGAVKDAFHERTKVFQHWQHAQQTLTKKRESKAKLELNGKTDKLDSATSEVNEWEAKVERGQEHFEKISNMIKLELERFEECRIQDFKTAIIKYLENHMEHQAQLIKIWEAFLPEAKSIV